MTYRPSCLPYSLVKAALIGLWCVSLAACQGTPPPHENFRRAHPERDAGDVLDAASEGAAADEGAGTAE